MNHKRALDDATAVLNKWSADNKAFTIDGAEMVFETRQELLAFLLSQRKAWIDQERAARA